MDSVKANPEMTAIVLAGGFGTRLNSVISDIPKPMAPISGKPFLEYLFAYLERNGITKVIMSVGYKYDIIKKYFGGLYQKIKIVYVVEKEPLGTGGAIKKALEKVDAENVFILNGDTFFNVDLSILNKQYSLNKSPLILALKKMENFDRYGSVEIDKNNRIVLFSEKTHREKGNINGGIYLIKKNIFEGFLLPKVFSFESFIQTNYRVLQAEALILEYYFIDIGIPEDYKTAQSELRSFV